MTAVELERFERKTEPEPFSGCWLWTAAANNKGYGRSFTGGRVVLAHRASYEHHHGAIPAGQEIDHTCRTRRCVNPRHLEPVTHTVNLRRGRTLTAANIAKTHCPNGHPYNFVEFSPTRQRAYRRCSTCRNAQARARARRVT